MQTPGTCRPQTQSDGIVHGVDTVNRELAALVGLSPNSIRPYINKRLWHRIPEPSGRAGNKHYWLVEDVRAWKRSRGV